MKNPLGAAGIVVISLVFLAAVFAYQIISDNTPNANEMHLVLAGERPGFEVDMLLVPKESSSKSTWLKTFFSGKSSACNAFPIISYKKSTDSLIYLEYNKGEGIPKSIALAEFREQGFSPKQNIKHRIYCLGTDRYGRDLLSRLLLGARISFSVGFISVLISILIGIPLGALGGYFGGLIDKIIMWFINVVWSIPTLLMIIAITLALGKGFWQVFIAIGFTMWVEVARVVRGQMLSVKEKEYIQAARVLGFDDVRIIVKHILPNIIAPIIVISAANFAAAILIESGISFLGVGVQPPMPSWGAMIKDHYPYIIIDKAYLAIYPGLAIMFLVLAFMLAGNALRDAMDVKY